MLDVSISGVYLERGEVSPSQCFFDLMKCGIIDSSQVAMVDNIQQAFPPLPPINDIFANGFYAILNFHCDIKAKKLQFYARKFSRAREKDLHY